MTVSATDIVNQALMMIGGNQPPVTGNAPLFDNSAAGKAAAQLYTPCVQTVGRQYGWDMARNTVALVLATGTAPAPWARQFLYPTNGIQVWQIFTTAGLDPNNPLPVNFVVANALISAVQTKIILCNLAATNAVAVYNNNPSETLWDPGFREAVVRLLASEMAMAIGGKPDAMTALLSSGSAFETIGEKRDN